MKRRTKTLIYLIGATIISVAASKFEGTVLFLFAIFASVLYGIGMIVSNYHFKRYSVSATANIIAFIIIFFLGTAPFYNLGLLINDNLTNNYYSFAFAMLGGFLLCLITVMVLYKGIVVNWITIVLMIGCPVAAFEIIKIPVIDKLDRLTSAIIIFQPLLTLIIVASIKNEKLNKKDIIIQF